MTYSLVTQSHGPFWTVRHSALEALDRIGFDPLSVVAMRYREEAL